MMLFLKIIFVVLKELRKMEKGKKEKWRKGNLINFGNLK
jgi:hypothetical protein